MANAPDEAGFYNHLGKTVVKFFPGFGYYFGIVVSFDPNYGYYKIKYDDDDEEELDLEELEDILVAEVRPYRKVISVRIRTSLRMTHDVSTLKEDLVHRYKLFKVEYEDGDKENVRLGDLLEILLGEKLQAITTEANLSDSPPAEVFTNNDTAEDNYPEAEEENLAPIEAPIAVAAEEKTKAKRKRSKKRSTQA